MSDVGYEIAAKKRARLIIGAVLGFIAIIILLIVWNMSHTRIEPGFRGVILSAGVVQDEKIPPRNPGLNLHWAWQSILEYPESKETVYLIRGPKDGVNADGTVKYKFDNSFKVNTADGKSVDADITYAFRMDTNKLAYIVNRFRKANAESIADTFIKQQLKSSVQAVTTQYSVLEVYGGEKRNEITKKVQDLFTQRMVVDGIIVEDFTFQDVRPDDITMQSIQRIVDSKNAEELLKQQAINAQQTANNNKIAAEGVKAVTLIQATQDAEVKKIAAQAEANKLMIEASAQAQANRDIAASVTQPLIDYTRANKWSGNYPSTLLDSSAQILLNK